MKVQKEKDKTEEWIKEQFLKDADAVMEEVERAEDLKDLAAPDSLKQKVMDRIQEEENRRMLYEQLSEEDREALRLGREAQMRKEMEALDVEAEEPIPIKRKRRTWKGLLVAASVAVLVLAMGLTSIGGRSFILDMFGHSVGGSNLDRVDSEREGLNQNEKIITGDEEFYKEVTELFGTEVVQMYYLPKNTEFLMGDIDEEGKLVCALYQYEEHVLEYQIISNYRTRSYGYDIEDELLDETQINVSDVPITVKEYRLPDGEHQFVAQFEYENCAYVLNACISEAEFHKILKNLKFF